MLGGFSGLFLLMLLSAMPFQRLLSSRVLGSITLPLVSRIFAKFWDRGYIFSKIISLALVSYFLLVFGIFKILPFSNFSIILIILIIFGFSLRFRRDFITDFRKKYPVFIAEELVFEPLGMSNSTFVYPLDSDKKQYEAMPHDALGISREPGMHLTALAHAGLVTTPTDLARSWCSSAQPLSWLIYGKIFRKLWDERQTTFTPRLFENHRDRRSRRPRVAFQPGF